jgi:hypothetical protein
MWTGAETGAGQVLLLAGPAAHGPDQDRDRIMIMGLEAWHAQPHQDRMGLLTAQGHSAKEWSGGTTLWWYHQHATAMVRQHHVVP